MSDAPTIYQKLLAANAEIDSYQSDLYVLKTPSVLDIINDHHPRPHYHEFNFRNHQKEGQLETWIEIPFAFDPWWERAS